MKGKHPLNALDALIPDYERLFRDVSPALEFVRQHEDTLRRLTENPVLDAIRRQDEMVRQLTSSPVIEAMRQQEELSRQIARNPIADVLQQRDEWSRQLSAVQTAFDSSAFSTLTEAAKQIADATASWREMADRVAADFSKLIPHNAFDEVNRIAVSLHGSLPTVPAFDATLLTTNYDELFATAVERFRERARQVAEDPDADIGNIEALVEEAAAATAASPAQSRAAMNAYVKIVLWWLLGVLAEDPVKTAAHKVLATFLIFLSTLQPAALPPLPQPPVLPAPLALPAPQMRGGLALPGGWQVESLPEVVKRAGPQASIRTLEFLTANIRNPNTRAAYANAIMRFFNWCDDRNLELDDITPFAVSAYIEKLGKETSTPTVKQHLAAIRMLFDWLVTGGVIPMNPASSVRGPKHFVKRGKTPVLSADQTRALLDSIDTSGIVGLRDRALIGVMVYTFARVSAAADMRLEDYFVSGKRWWFRLHEKDGKRHDVPAHHNAEHYMDAYLSVAGLGQDAKGPLFPTLGRDRRLTSAKMTRTDVLRMIKRRAAAAGLPASTCCHTFRATGITAYLENGGSIERAQQIAAHESLRTTELYHRRSDELTLDEIERIII
jgi:integrase/recombinase XerD